MNEIKTTKNSPEKVSLEKDKKYFWCTCGLSGNQPFCDGAHKASNEFKPHHFEVEETKEYYLCNCKIHLFATDLTIKSLNIFF